jgi:NADP-dependent 3-hydroxy acid dehydrogenase YdfG
MAEKQVLVITGASSGIGAATAKRAVEFDYRVVLAARSEDKLSSLVEELGGDDMALAVRCDVTSWDDQQALVQQAVDRFGRMDAFLANAGVGAKRGFLEESVEFWKSMIDTNVLGAALSIRAALAHWRDSGNHGHMLLTSSVAGRRTLPGSKATSRRRSSSRAWSTRRSSTTGQKAPSSPTTWPARSCSPSPSRPAST